MHAGGISAGSFSGTVRGFGIHCEYRERIEIVDEGEAKTGFMKYGDRVRMQGTLPDGRAPFGAIDPKVVKP